MTTSHLNSELRMSTEPNPYDKLYKGCSEETEGVVMWLTDSGAVILHTDNDEYPIGFIMTKEQTYTSERFYDYWKLLPEGDGVTITQTNY